MPRTERHSAEISHAVRDDLTYEDVRLSFLVRLHGEERRLAALREELASAQSERGSVFNDLEHFAHRLRGAAAVFGLPEICDAAKNLELSCVVAATGNATLGESLVQDTIRTLAARLSCLNGFTGESKPEDDEHA